MRIRLSDWSSLIQLAGESRRGLRIPSKVVQARIGVRRIVKRNIRTQDTEANIDSRLMLGMLLRTRWLPCLRLL